MLQQSSPDLKRRIQRQLARATIAGHISASDIVQDTCQKVIEKHDQFRGQTTGEWQLWLRKIAASLLLAQLHKQSNLSLRDIFPPRPETPIDQLFNSSKSPSEKLSQKEREAILRAAIDGLTFRDQQLIYYRCELGLRWEEVGGKIGCSADAAWNRFNLYILPELQVRLGILSDAD